MELTEQKDTHTPRHISPVQRSLRYSQFRHFAIACYSQPDILYGNDIAWKTNPVGLGIYATAIVIMYCWPFHSVRCDEGEIFEIHFNLEIVFFVFPFHQSS